MNDGPIKVAPKQWAIQEARSKPKRGKASCYQSIKLELQQSLKPSIEPHLQPNCKPSSKAGRSQVAPIRRQNRSAGKAASSE